MTGFEPILAVHNVVGLLPLPVPVCIDNLGSRTEEPLCRDNPYLFKPYRRGLIRCTQHLPYQGYPTGIEPASFAPQANVFPLDDG